MEGLLTLTAKGNSPAFSRLVDLYWRTVYCQALTYCRSAQLSEELTQDVFVKIWDNREKLTGIGNFENYLFIVARNAIVSAMRRRRADIYPGEPSGSVEPLWQPDLQLVNKEKYALLLKAIDHLPPQRKQVFTLSRIDGLSHEEISARLGISKNTIKEHIIKGLNFLRGYLYAHAEVILSFVIFLGRSHRSR